MHLPVFYNHKDGGYKKDYYDMSGDPLYPFGFGLSYTEFIYDNLQIKRESIAAETLADGEKFCISLNVTNAGDNDGYDVIQLYIKGKAGSIIRRVKELKGFKKVWLAAGETKEVRFELGAEELQVYSSHNTYKVEQGDFEIEVGNPVSSLSAALNIG